MEYTRGSAYKLEMANSKLENDTIFYKKSMNIVKSTKKCHLKRKSI